MRERQAERVSGASAELIAEERVLDALVGPGASPATRDSLPQAPARAASSTTRRSRSRCRYGGAGMPTFEIPGMPGAQIGVINIGDMFGKALAAAAPRRAASTVRRITRPS